MKISTDEIKLRTIAERNSVTRSILGFFISSAAVKFLKQEEFEKLKRAFLHPEPGEIVHNFYFSIPEESQNYKIDIATLTLFWTAKEDRIKDKIGNLWTIYRLNISFSAKERYGIYGKLLDNWLECIESIAKFVSEIKKNYSKEISIMTHSSSERIELEKKEKEQKEQEAIF